MTQRIGIDVGGTFTDFVLLDRVEGRAVHHKEPSTPARPSDAVESGLKALLARAGSVPSDIELIVHGTTLSLNALLQRRGARVALVVSTGCRDILELARIRMAHAYDFFAVPESPLVPREHVFEIATRVASDGGIVARSTDDELAAVAEALRVTGAESVVVSLVNGHVAPACEADIAMRLGRALSHLSVVAATGIWPEEREYERTMVAVMNGYIEPLMRRYYRAIEAMLHEGGFTAPLTITGSNGGTIDLETACARPIDTVLSGPAAGVVAALQTGLANGVPRIVTFDMGGTSADIAVIEDGAADLTTRSMIGEIPLITPVVDVSAIGAGGGSIVRVDSLGVLKVGPDSAGAHPGPVCYGRGGTQPTITDCYLVCGYLDGEAFLGGRMPLSEAAARAALKPMAKALGFDNASDPEAMVAAAALRVASSMMATEVRKLVARRGSDSRDFTLMPYGGAGATHAALLADEAGMSSILVPRTPATFCALGAVVAPLRRDFVRSSRLKLLPSAEVVEGLQSRLDDMLLEARDWTVGLGDRVAGWKRTIAADMRYPGQAFDLSVVVGELTDTRADRLTTRMRDAFTTLHRRLYGFAKPEAAIDITRLVVSAAGTMPDFAAERPRAESSGRSTTRRAFMRGDWHDVPCVPRSRLDIGAAVAGPSLVEQSDTTVLVPPGWTAVLLPTGDLRLEHGEGSR